MAHRYSDDQEITRLNAKPGTAEGAFESEGTTAMFYNKKNATLGPDNFTVLLELTGTEGNDSDDRAGLDVVIVLDVSGSMRGKNLDNLKTASTFLVKKLSSVDRLSVVKFSSTAERLCPLTLMKPDAQTNVERIIDGLFAGGGTNMTAGLEEAVEVLRQRRFTDGRLTAIMFMSDGDASADGSGVELDDIPVHTFGLGRNYNPTTLKKMAERSNGGTFNSSDVNNPQTSNLSTAFALCLGGLLTTVIKDLKLIITRIESTIQKVSAGNYPQTRDDLQGSVTVTFGNLYCRETRKVLVNLVLDKVDKVRGTDILEFTYLYKRVVGDTEYDVPPRTITVFRTPTSSEEEIPEILNEIAREETAAKMKAAREMADKNKFSEARGKLDEARSNLERAELDQLNPVIAGLLAEVKQFKNLMATPEIYEQLGRAFAFASELSHALQRASARGNVDELRLFATEAMNQAIEQAKMFERNPKEYKVPTLADDKKQRKVEDEKKRIAELEKKPLEEVVNDITTQLDEAFKALDAIKALTVKIQKA